jgi:cytochrome P450
MALTQQTEPQPAAPGCPVDHAPRRKSVRDAGRGSARLERDAAGVWHARGFDEVRAILRDANSRQAGFNAEMLVSRATMPNRPILYQEGKAHLEQRKQTARFFTPKTVSANYRRLMEAQADRLIAEARHRRRFDLSRLSLTMAMQVAAQVVGLTNSRVAGMAARLDAFFAAPPDAASRSPLGRLRQVSALRRLALFYWMDVRPAIRARKRRPQEDVISHLLAHGYSAPEILTECVTYGAAGMATTREFISMAAWHFLEHPVLRAQYLAAPEAERLEILHETLRLEPVIGHLYRRATADIALTSEGAAVVIPQGALIDIEIDAANVDTAVVGAEPLALCPGRPLRGDRVPAMLASFGDGAHRCPGSYLAIQETDIFLRRLLALEGLRIERPPTLTWNELSAGYELRDFMLAL